jgi:hypothetical protein
MKTVTRAIFYCDHCNRHRLTPHAIVSHEPKCIYNPERSRCGWHAQPFVPAKPGVWTAELKQSLDLDWLRRTVGGCPACMLAVVVQAGLTSNEQYDLGFNYTLEVERFRQGEREEWNNEERRQIEATFL